MGPTPSLSMEAMQFLIMIPLIIMHTTPVPSHGILPAANADIIDGMGCKCVSTIYYSDDVYYIIFDAGDSILFCCISIIASLSPISQKIQKKNIAASYQQKHNLTTVWSFVRTIIHTHTTT